MITIKKLTIIFLAIVMFFMPMLMTYNQQQAHAAIVSKPISFAAKKAAKELASDVAFEMVGNLALKYAVDKFDDHDVKPGFKPICLVGGKSDIKDCPPESKAQVKADLSATDKTNLRAKVENVVELKTGTSSKWAKFLDWFVPVFLIGGIVAAVSSVIDGESGSLMDEIAQQSLIDTGLLKPLKVKSEDISIPLYDFSKVLHATNVNVTKTGNRIYHVTINNTKKSGVGDIKMTITGPKGDYTETFKGGYYLKLTFISSVMSGASFYPSGSQSTLEIDSSYSTYDLTTVLYEGSTRYNTIDDAFNDGANYLYNNYVTKFLALNGDINGLNNLLSKHISLSGAKIVYNIETLTPPEVHTDYGTQTAIDLVKDQTGAVTVPGIDKFTFKDPVTDKEVYPSGEGWRDKETTQIIEDIVVDDIIVTDKLPNDEVTPEPPTKPDEYPKCDKDFNKIEFKKVGTAFTYAFPFSIPWDVKRYIDAAFGGVGSERPSFALFGFFGDARIELPAYFDNWMPFLHGALVLMFDLSLIYLFYRFMGRGGD